MKSAFDSLEQVEIQSYIDRYQNLTPEELEKKLLEVAEFTATQEQNLLLQEALIFLLEQSDPAPQVDPIEALNAFFAEWEPPTRKRPCRKRLVIVAAIVAALLLLSAVACATQHWSLFLNIQEKYTQPMTSPGPQATVESWTSAPVPTLLHAGFSITDAKGSETNFAIEFSNSEGGRYYVYYSDDNTSSFLDTELALLGNALTVGNTTIYLVEKDELTTIYWNLPPGIASIDICEEAISLDDAIAVAESMTKAEGEN